MSFAVSIYFDPKIENQIKEIWRSFDTANLPNHKERTFRPHITLCIYEEINCADCECKINEVSSQFILPAINFDHLGIFNGVEKVLFLAPTPNEHLLAMQRKVFHMLSTFVRKPWKMYEPDMWVPHCTLANDLSEKELKKAIEIALAIQLPIHTGISQIGIVEFDPIQPVFQVDIKK